MTDTQGLIHDDKAEKYVIGSLISDNTVYGIICQYLDEDCFFDQGYKTIWTVIDKMEKEGSPVDLISVSSELFKIPNKSIDVNLVIDACGSVATTANVEFHAIHLKDLSRRRKLWELGVLLSQAGLSEVTETAEIHKKATEVLNGIFDKADSVFTLADAMNSLGEIMKQNMTQGNATTGTPTGFAELDKKGGLQGSDLIIIAGETSQGKTSFALSLARNAILNDAKIAFYSMEMTKEQLSARLLSSMSEVPANTILYSAYLSPQDLSQIDEAREKLIDKNLYFDDRSTSNIDSILMSIRMLKMLYDIDGAFVDYLQILNVNAKGISSREQVMGESARRLKNLAKELNIWIAALSQLSRDANNPEPNLNRLRDSGQIAEAADVVMFVYRPEFYNRPYPTPFDNINDFPTSNTAMIDVAKGRNIGTFKFFLGFNKKTTSFYVTDSINMQENIPPAAPIEADAPF